MQTLLGNYRIFVFITVSHWALTFVAFALGGGHRHAEYSVFEQLFVKAIEAVTALPLSRLASSMVVNAEDFWIVSLVNSTAFALAFLAVINLYNFLYSFLAAGFRPR